VFYEHATALVNIATSSNMIESSDMDPKKYPRAGGFIIFAVAALLSAWFYQNTLDSAAKHVQDTIYVPHAFAVLVAFACLGIGMMILGEKMQAYSKGLRGRKLGIKDFLIIGTFVVPGFIAFFFLQHQLGQLGYN
jgi:hypothetical protein